MLTIISFCDICKMKDDDMIDLEEIETDVKNNKNTKKEQIKKTVSKIAIVCICIVFIFLFIACSVSMFNQEPDKKNSTYYLKSYTEEFILNYYNLKFPDTFKLKTFECFYYEIPEEKGYMVYRTEGYFTAESSIGLEIKKTYNIYINYIFEENECYPLWVSVDGDTYYGGSYKVNPLI